MSNAKRRANGPALPDDEPCFRIAHLLRDPALRTAFKTVEDGLGPIPPLPHKNEIAAAGSDEARWIFHRAYWQTKVAISLHELVEGQFCVDSHELSGKVLDDFQAARRISLDRLREALMRFAKVPAMTTSQLERKKEIIRKAWRDKAVFRDALARDEAYLRAKASALKEARR
jgi:hypothetical protein